MRKDCKLKQSVSERSVLPRFALQDLQSDNNLGVALR
jgi:hypothetical protein